VPILHGISREHYAMHAAQLFIDQSSLPHAHVECAPGMGHIRQKMYLFKSVVKFFLECVLMFLHDILYIL